MSQYEHVRDTMARLEREGRTAELEDIRAQCRAETAIDLPPIVLDEPVAVVAPVPFVLPIEDELNAWDRAWENGADR